MPDLATAPPAALKPLDPRLSAEVRDWVVELRKVWAATGLSMNRFAAVHPVDKGTLSRYLNGQRVPGDGWFLDQLLRSLADEDRPVTPAVRQYLTTLHLCALQTAHPHEYRVRLVRDELENALTGKQEAERYARALERQLTERNRRIREVTEDRDRLRAVWDAQHDRLIREAREIASQLAWAQARAAQAEQRCQELEGLLDQLDSVVPEHEGNAGALLAEDAATQLEKVKDQLLASTSHELRTPITVVHGYASALAQRWDQLSETDRRVAVKTIAERAGSLGRLVEQLLLGSRASTGQLPVRNKPFELAKLLQKNVSAFQPLSDIHELTAGIPPDLPGAYGDSMATDIIIGQLLENAFKYSPNGGNVRLAACVIENWIEVTVDDEGIGIAEGDLERIFDRFVQGEANDRRSYGGVGIGLYIVRRLAAAQGGVITAGIRPGGGTSMHLRLQAVFTPKPLRN